MTPRRPPLEAKVKLDLLSALSAGSTREAAALYAGVDLLDLEERIAASRAFASEVKAAEARPEVSNVAAIARAAKGGDWRAASFLLERTPRPFDPDVHCGAATNPLNGATPCKQAKGTRTDHLGSGHCWLHGGRSPAGAKAAGREAAGKALAKLGVPVGSGDPFVLLAKVVSHAEGYLEATAQLAREASSAKTPLVGLEAIADLYEQAIRTAARTGKAAVDADVADRLATLDERVDSLLWRFVAELLERVVPAAQRPAVEAWASMRLGEIAAEYEHPVAVH